MVWIIGLVCIVGLVWLWALGVIEVRGRRDGFTEVIENETHCACGDDCGMPEDRK